MAEETSVAAALELAMLGLRDPAVLTKSWLLEGPADWGPGRVVLSRYRDIDHFLMARIEERQQFGGLVGVDNKLRHDLPLDLSLAQPSLAIPRRKR